MCEFQPILIEIMYEAYKPLISNIHVLITGNKLNYDIFKENLQLEQLTLIQSTSYNGNKSL
jgi:hypothetical protein